MPGETTFQKIKYALGVDEVKKFPAEVSEPGAKTIDKFLEERNPTVKSYAGSATLNSGEFAIQEKAGETFTLPSCTTANRVITCYCSTIASVKVKAQAGQKIYGDFINGVEVITLTELQHVTLQSNGTAWDITAGEPKREQKYDIVQVERLANTLYTPNTTRPTFVAVEVVGQGNAAESQEIIGRFRVEGRLIGEYDVGVPTFGARFMTSFIVPPGQTWEWGKSSNSKLFSSYLTL